MKRTLIVASVTVLALLATRCTATPDVGQDAEPPRIDHVHGIAADPRGGDLFVATHNGIFIVTPTGEVSGPIGGYDFDSMGFTVADKTLFASGHPGPETPTELGSRNLGIIRSDDFGESWSPVAFTSTEDFHVLTAGPDGTLYGIGSSAIDLLISTDDGIEWTRGAPLAAADIAATNDGVYAATEEGPQVSTDKGATFTLVDGAPVLYSIDARQDGTLIGAGACYDGLHEPLVSPEVWYRVQNVLTAHQVSGEKTQSHDHYLKGTIYCGDCHSRLTVTHAKNRHGNVYPYFMCSGRHSKRTDCIRKAMPVIEIEAKIEDYYRRVQIPEHVVTALRQMLTHQFDALQSASKNERRILIAERDKLRDERRSLLHAHHAGAVPLDLLKEEQDRLARRLAFLDARIDAGQIEYEQAKAHLDDCLALAGDAHAIYMSLDDSLRRIANQAFFERIEVYEEVSTDRVQAVHGEPFDALFDPALHADALTYVERLSTNTDGKAVDVVGLNIQHWVGPAGIEPTTSTV